ncbi:MAG: GNAT family N-acetyltransferase [Streptosporangiales bacterium]|nr:GNAT family N-acetyltransferase [Streptosporangiales bacterium]
MLRTSPLRVLDDGDLTTALELLDADPVTNVFVGSRVHASGLDPGRLGAEVWGYHSRGRLESMCYAGANLVPINAGPEAVRSFADRTRWQGRRCSSIVGPAEPVGRLWDLLRRHWGPAREVRAVQPVMATSSPSGIEPDQAVRRVRPGELGTLLPACVAMFTEEVGVPPDAGDGGALYRARVDELIRLGRAFARIEDGQVIFKAEVGAVTPYACQVQGVWVRPDLRGRRYAVHGMAAVVNEALRSIAPTVSLYVNDYNMPARATYRRVGFADVATFSSILF